MKLPFVMAMALCGCSAAQSFYPKEGFVPGSLPANEPERVSVYFDQDAPRCLAREIAIIRYDALRDGIFSSQEIVIRGLRKQAAQLGAQGIYRIKFTPAAVIGTAVFMSAAAATEYSGQATAFVCP